MDKVKGDGVKIINRGALSLAEVFGLTDPKRRLRETRLAMGGDPFTPRSKWGLSSLGILRPRLSVKTWLGWRPEDRLVPVINLFNRTPTPLEDGWSIKKSQVQDFRGRRLTYDSHNGTDFAIPPATVVVAAAPGVVRRISDEFHRGGLKIVIDHGFGLITTTNHLGRSLVEVGDRVSRGQAIALSAYSGIDALLGFPWSAPHIHFNVWLNGKYVDPFARPGEISLWRRRNDPVPFQAGKDFQAEKDEESHDESDHLLPSKWDEEGLQAVIDGCRDPALRAQLAAVEELDRRAVDTIFMKNYFPTRFAVNAPIYGETFQAKPRLDLPLRAEDYEGIRLL